MKTVIFDFDGTLTQKNQNIWKMLWQKMGYEVDKNSQYAQLYVQHVINKEISRGEWFNKTCEAFIKKGMTQQDLIDVSTEINLIDGFSDTIKHIYENGYSIHIVSGCIKESIEIVLGNNKKYFSNIESNRCVFDVDGKLQKLIPTNFDYSGKAKYIEKLKALGVDPRDIIFIGNSDNDEWVYSTGCKTICINPENADSTKWQIVKENVYNLKEILPEIQGTAKLLSENPNYGKDKYKNLTQKKDTQFKTNPSQPESEMKR